MTDQVQFNALAAQLTATLPDDAGKYAAGGILSKVVALITALKVGDVTAILKAVYELLGEFVSDGSTNFGAPIAGLGMDLGSLLSILATILALLGKK